MPAASLRRFLLPLILAAALAAGAAPAHATFAGVNGKLALGSSNYNLTPDFEQRNQFVYAVNPDGTGLQLLADRNSGRGLWSPDGMRLAFQSGLPSGCCIYTPSVQLINTDGSGLATALPPDAQRDLLGWAPGGERLLFLSKPPMRQVFTRLFAARLDGSGLTQLSDGPTEGTPGGGGPPPTTSDDYAGAWSPTQSKIAFLRRVNTPTGDTYVTTNELWVVNPDGTGDTRITDDGGVKEGLAWSVDGASLAYTRNVVPAGAQVWKIGADGTGKVQLTNFPAVGNLGISDLSWSPDGSKIAFNRSGIYTMNPGGSALKLISNTGGGAVWSPDSRKLAFSDQDPGDPNDSAVYTVNADGSGRTLVADTPNRDSVTDWQSLPGSVRTPADRKAKRCKARRHIWAESRLHRRGWKKFRNVCLRRSIPNPRTHG